MEALSFNYKWTLEYIYGLDFYEALLFYRKTREREKNKAKTELRMLQLMTTAIHTGEPKNFIEKLEDAIQGELYKEEIGDLGSLEKLGNKRKGYRRAGDM